MSSFSLRLPYLIYLTIGSIFMGVLIAPVFRDVPAGSLPEAPMAMAGEHMHTSIEVPAEGAPTLTMKVEKDPSGGWNVTLLPVNFSFTPEAVNGPNTPNTGHAHLYVNEQKIARVYGTHFHMPDLPPGQHEVVVVLSTNDHSFYTVNGVRIEARAMIMQGEPAIAAANG
ncbi:MAG: hypothetical protein AAF601_07980 [Pseudomonadota bacterium]